MDKAQFNRTLERIKEESTELLEKYNYNPTDVGMGVIFSEFVDNKMELIELLSKHHNYNPDTLQIVFETGFHRVLDCDMIDSFWAFMRYDCVLSINSDNTQMMHHILESLRRVYSNTIKYTELEDTLTTIYGCISAETVMEYIKDTVKIKDGMKTSRAVRKFCKFYGFDQHPDFERKFAQYGDAINPMEFKQKIIISVNPYDYWTMSFGNSWASCHTIDKENLRGRAGTTYQGCYSGGTESYMLDGSSLVVYTVSANETVPEGDKYYKMDKVTRQMFHYGDNKLIQGRLYPQSNDNTMGVEIKYQDYRNILQSVFAECLGVPNLWVVSNANSIESYVETCGVHYADYLHPSDIGSHCTLSTLSGADIENSYVYIGHNPICPHCGDEHNTEDCIECNCRYYKQCNYCGRDIDTSYDTYTTIDGEYYCRDCYEHCDTCGNDFVIDENEFEQIHYWYDYCNNNRYSRRVCSSCRENNYVECECCGIYSRRSYSEYNLHTVVEDGVSSRVCTICNRDNYIHLTDTKTGEIRDFHRGRVILENGKIRLLSMDEYLERGDN